MQSGVEAGKSQRSVTRPEIAYRISKMPLGIKLAIAALLGLGLGFLLGWLVGRRRGVSAPDQPLVEDLRRRIQQRDAEVHELQVRLQEFSGRNGGLTEQVKALGEQLANERQRIETLQDKLRKDFEDITRVIVADNASSFSRQSTESLENLLKPLKEKLGEFKSSLDRTHDATTTNSAMLKEQVSRIGDRKST